MNKIRVDISNIFNFVSEKDIFAFQQKIEESIKSLVSKTGKGNDFLGWVDLPDEITETVLSDINAKADFIRRNAEVLVVIGIGGSYLGARAVIEALKHNFDFLLPDDKQKDPIVLYAGQNLSEEYLADLLEVLDKKSYAINVISKSGTTTEPAVTFRILKNHLESKYGKKEAAKRIVATTDKSRGALKQLSTSEGYTTFIVPDDVGGRYSVLTPVGLFPIAVAGFNISELIRGASDMRKQVTGSYSITENPAAMYAAARNALLENDKFVEITVNYLPNLYYFTEWWKQLFGESEGKEGKGIFPAGVVNTTDLHSMGQYIQEGKRKLFETVISVEKSHKEVLIPDDESNLDSLNFISGKNIHYVNQMAERGTTLAHLDGGVPNIKITIPEVNEYYLGQLIYFYEFACAISGYVLGVNPFDQPGVEAYKKNMFALLGKPGFEKENEEIRKRI
ncbi:MAG: glucose-6-phosphate isomerase [Marinilabiliales bacterium]|nr:MAG: glucose-6-phosphate isomerase [Marinilabiliales bacterium]